MVFFNEGFPYCCAIKIFNNSSRVSTIVKKLIYTHKPSKNIHLSWHKCDINEKASNALLLSSMLSFQVIHEYVLILMARLAMVAMVIITNHHNLCLSVYCDWRLLLCPPCVHHPAISGFTRQQIARTGTMITLRSPFSGHDIGHRAMGRVGF